MNRMDSVIRYFSKTELLLWSASMALILTSFFWFGGGELLSLTASVIGVTSLILNAKGNPLGQVLMILFSLLYGVISWSFSYYGEMITYLGMTAPMAAAALVEWLRNPYQGGRAEVRVGRLDRQAAVWMALFTIVVTIAFYFILRAFHTANLLLSTVSVATSFLAAWLTCRRSPLFALAYAANDVVLIGLWLLASAEDPSFLSVVICFAVFFVNDLYGFASWSRMRRRQEAI